MSAQRPVLGALAIVFFPLNMLLYLQMRTVKQSVIIELLVTAM